MPDTADIIPEGTAEKLAQLSDAFPTPATGTGSAVLLEEWDAFACLTCDRRYAQPVPTHGAPERCPGSLIPVTVQIRLRTT
jgi:hypothetical protein